MSEDRWTTLSELYKTMRQTFQNDYFRAAHLAKALKKQLAEKLGCKAGNVLLYDYDETTMVYTPERDAFKAVSMNGNYVWFLGYGVTLEQAPDAYPKTTFQFPVRFHLSSTATEVDTSFGKFTLTGDQLDFTEPCDAIYEGLKTSLVMRTNKQTTDKKFGFLDFGVKHRSPDGA